MGILNDSKLYCSNQCRTAAAKAYKFMRYISKGIDAHDKSIVLPFYHSLVRTHTKYCVVLGPSAQERHGRVLMYVKGEPPK